MSILDNIFVEKTPERKYKYINLNEGIKEIKSKNNMESKNV